MVLHIHGGPHGMYNVGFNSAFQNFAANGYLLLYTNPRGSTGYGTDFGNAIDNGYPSVDYDDLMAWGGRHGRARLRGREPDVRHRMQWWRGSFFLGDRSDEPLRRRCGAVSGGQLDELCRNRRHRALGLHPLPRLPLGQRREVPGTLAADVRGPGHHSDAAHDRGTRSAHPDEQTEEYYQALKALEVPTEMVRFYEEYHGTSSQPSNFIRTQLYMLDWFSRYTRDPARETDP